MGQGEFQDKVAIVTGSASGIGAATAIGLAARGAKVVINYTKSEAEAQATAAAARAAGGDCLLVQGDVAQDEACRALAAAALDAWGRIDILVNNAGITKFAKHNDLDALSAEDFASIYAVNVIGPFQMIRACAGALKASGSGAVVNISSVAGIAGLGSSVAYAASKGALNTMTLSLARALAPEIRVNAVCPGYVATRWFRDRFGEERFARINAEQAETTPLKHAGQPDDIADTVLFLCGTASRHMTGEMLMVDGGLHLSFSRP
jgi:3-oxoacyl-[acyl-carrier protein] reductase